MQNINSKFDKVALVQTGGHDNVSLWLLHVGYTTSLGVDQSAREDVHNNYFKQNSPRVTSPADPQVVRITDSSRAKQTLPGYPAVAARG